MKTKNSARNKALEEAARLVESYKRFATHTCQEIADEIRELKEKEIGRGKITKQS